MPQKPICSLIREVIGSQPVDHRVLEAGSRKYGMEETEMKWQLLNEEIFFIRAEWKKRIYVANAKSLG